MNTVNQQLLVKHLSTYHMALAVQSSNPISSSDHPQEEFTDELLALSNLDGGHQWLVQQRFKCIGICSSSKLHTRFTTTGGYSKCLSRTKIRKAWLTNRADKKQLMVFLSPETFQIQFHRYWPMIMLTKAKPLLSFKPSSKSCGKKHWGPRACTEQGIRVGAGNKTNSAWIGDS